MADSLRSRASLILTPTTRRNRRDQRVRALHELAARRRSLAIAMAAAEDHPDKVDPIDVIDCAMAAQAADEVVRHLDEEPVS